jgi:hypothetical protein
MEKIRADCMGTLEKYTGMAEGVVRRNGSKVGKLFHFAVLLQGAQG